VLAIVLALLTSELILQRIPDPHFQREGRVRDDPAHMHRRDAQLGWTMMSSHTVHDRRGGREVDYAFDEHGCRVADAASRVDPARPTLVFVGESYVLGAGLLWSETLPARMAAMFGVQSANCAVDAYSSDQQYMRLANELPRFEQPCRRRAVRDAAVRAQPGHRSPSPRCRLPVARSAAAVAPRSAGEARRALSLERRDRSRRDDDAGDAARNTRARPIARRGAADPRAAVPAGDGARSRDPPSGARPGRDSLCLRSARLRMADPR
jgi:hypothetical protein